jgi:hypothetical protein
MVFFADSRKTGDALCLPAPERFPCKSATTEFTSPTRVSGSRCCRLHNPRGRRGEVLPGQRATTAREALWHLAWAARCGGTSCAARPIARVLRALRVGLLTGEGSSCVEDAAGVILAYEPTFLPQAMRPALGVG